MSRDPDYRPVTRTETALFIFLAMVGAGAFALGAFMLFFP